MLILIFERPVLRDEPGRAGGEEGRGDPVQASGQAGEEEPRPVSGHHGV
jgi:hypothetical protein